MKSVSPEYDARERSTLRLPGELFHIWIAGHHWRYTSGDVAFVYDGNTYVPAPIAAGEISTDSELNATTVDVEIPRITDPMADYIQSNPAEPVWLSIMAIHKGMTTPSVSLKFVGRLKRVGIKGVAAKATFVGLEDLLSTKVPMLRYQISCNHAVYSQPVGYFPACGLDKATYKTTTVVEVAESGTRLISIAFGEKASDWFNYGWVKAGYDRRPITDHAGTSIWVKYPFPNLVSGQTITVYPGCDGTAETCRDKFNNISHHLGFKFIPLDNPVTWRIL